MAEFDPKAGYLTVRRWVFILDEVYPDEKAPGIAGWRGQVVKSKKTNGKFQFFIKIDGFVGSWFLQNFVKGLRFLSN